MIDNLPQENINIISTPQPVYEKKNNFLVILLSILLILSIGIAGFFAYQTQKLVNDLENYKRGIDNTSENFENDSISNWAVYTDEIYNFSFKYPSDWKLRCSTDLPNGWLDRGICDLTSPQAVLDHGQIKNGYYLTVSASKPNPNYANFSEYITYSSKEHGYTYKDRKINNINGKIALLDDNETNFLFEKDGHIINLNWISSEDTEMIEQILSTFKLVN